MEKKNLIFTCLLLLCSMLFTNALFGQIKDTKLITLEDIASSHFTLKKDGINIFYSYPVYEKEDRVISRLTDQDSIVFFIDLEKNKTEDSLYVAVSEDGPGIRGFKTVATISLPDEVGVYKAAISCPIKKQGNRFVSWTTKKPVLDDQLPYKDPMALDELFLSHTIRPF